MQKRRVANNALVLVVIFLFLAGLPCFGQSGFR